MHPIQNTEETSMPHSLTQQIHREQQDSVCKARRSFSDSKSAGVLFESNGITSQTTSERTVSNYDGLTRIAGHRLRHDRLRWTIEPEELVHETYLRMMKHGERIWTSQEHFLGTAVIAMGNCLIDLARARNARKRCTKEVLLGERS